MEGGFVIELTMPNGAKQMYDNHGKGFSVANAVRYTEVGELPITIRYLDNGQMFPAAMTVVLEYCEAPAQVTVRTMDGSRSDTKTFGGIPGCESVGVFRLYESKKTTESNDRVG